MNTCILAMVLVSQFPSPSYMPPPKKVIEQTDSAKELFEEISLAVNHDSFDEKKAADICNIIYRRKINIIFSVKHVREGNIGPSNTKTFSTIGMFTKKKITLAWWREGLTLYVMNPTVLFKRVYISVDRFEANPVFTRNYGTLVGSRYNGAYSVGLENTDLPADKVLEWIVANIKPSDVAAVNARGTEWTIEISGRCFLEYKKPVLVKPQEKKEQRPYSGEGMW